MLCLFPSFPFILTTFIFFIGKFHLNINIMLKLLVIGHLGKDATVNNVNGKNVINFTVAHSEKFKDAQGAQVDKTIWVECSYWTERTAIAPYLKKGTQVYAEGIPDIRNYTTQDGRTGSSLILRVSSVQLLGSKEGGVDAQQSAGGYSATSHPQTASAVNQQTVSSPSSAPVVEGAIADDLPF